jgi:hypothetical protein
MKTPVQVSHVKFLWILFKVGIIVALLASIMSCTKEDEIPAPSEKVKIFASALPSQDGLKSATTNTEVALGDTVWFPRDVNSLMWAVDQFGLPANGAWKIEMIKTDIMILFQESSGYNPIGRYTSYFGDQIAHKFPEIGLYRISFGQLTDANKMGEEFFFFVRVSGTPGKVGDKDYNNNIFRMENKVMTDTSTRELRSLIFIYFKFSSEQKMDPEKAYCFLTSFKKDGSVISTPMRLKRWQFSRDYYYLVIPPDSESTGQYRVVFMVSDTQGFDGYADQNNYRSSWWGKYGIEFAAQ